VSAKGEQTQLAEDPRDTLSIAEVAKRLGLSPRATRKAVVRGEVPAIRIGRRLLVLRAPFEELLQAGGSLDAKPRASTM
jgi:excisionase family DNA binding protein